MKRHAEGTTSRAPRTTASLLFLCFMTTGLTALPGQAAPPRASTTIDYVAVGDSYTAGQGAPPYDGSGCYQSPSMSYPARVDELRSVALKLNAACSGASTADIAAQLSYTDEALDLVTVTVGGIDAGSNEIAAACHDGVVDEDCNAVLSVDATEEAELKVKLAGAYDAISRKYPAATVAVMGYPRMFTGFYLASDFPRALNGSIDNLDRIISEQAVASGVRFVDVRDEFNGHEIGSFRPWINYNSNDLAEPANFHPNAAGYKSGYHQALVNEGVIPRR